jgi:hypothetical protein
MSNERKTRERFIILLPDFCYYCLGSSFLTSHDYTNIQLRYSSAIASYTSLYPPHYSFPERSTDLGQMSHLGSLSCAEWVVASTTLEPFF